MQQPGWYPSPNYPGQLQYWTGHGWTPQIKPMPVEVDGPPPTGTPYEHTSLSAPAPAHKNINIKPKWILRALAGFLLLSGLIPLAITAPSAIDSLAGNKTEVVGTVVDLDHSTYTSTSSKNRSRSSKPSCAPIVEYSVNGQTYTARSSVYTAPCPHTIGESITVKYDNSEPSQGKIKLNGALAAIMWVFFTIGCLFTIAGLGMLIKSFILKKD